MLYVAIIFNILAFFGSKSIISPFLQRKLLHIGMANWWWIRLFIFDSILYACIGPFAFCFINLFIEKKSNIKKHGMTYFAVSLLFCTICSFYNAYTCICATIAIMILGFADPMAAIVGGSFSKDHKTIQGSVTFFLTTMIVLLVANITSDIHIFFFEAMSIGVVVSFVESKVLPECDNLLIPIVVFILCYVLGK